MFTLGRDLVDSLLQEVEEKEQNHTNVECSKCRRTIKVPRKKLERMRPR
jgi:hypothetical protein